MKTKLLIPILTLLFMSCSKESEQIIGNWTVDSYTYLNSSYNDNETKVSFNGTHVTTISIDKTTTIHTYEIIGDKIYITGVDKDKKHGVGFSVKRNKMTISTSIGHGINTDPAIANLWDSYLSRD